MTTHIPAVADMPPGWVVTHGPLIVRRLPGDTVWRSQHGVVFKPHEVAGFVADGAEVTFCRLCEAGVLCHAHEYGGRHG